MLLSKLDRRVLATLKESTLKRVPPGLRIAVGGNCQSFGIAYAMKLLNVDATVDLFPMDRRSKITGNMLVSALRTYDHVFLQPFDEQRVRKGSWELLDEKLTNVTWYPGLLFAGYHPDSIFVSDRAKGDAFVSGPIGQHHSALALFAYRAGLSPEAALRLYNREVFDTLGYFDVWHAASAQFLDAASYYSLDLKADFIRWTRRGCFMYSINHPKPHVIFDVARRLLEKAGVPSQPVDFDHYAVDDLARDTVFPVYPDIAEHFGIAGGYVFKAPEHAAGTLKIGDFWDLLGFICESYRVYSRRDADQLANERVQGWLDDAEISNFLREVGSPASRHAAAERRTPVPLAELVPLAAS
jgi:hypothetical protein